MKNFSSFALFTCSTLLLAACGDEGETQPSTDSGVDVAEDAQTGEELVYWPSCGSGEDGSARALDSLDSSGELHTRAEALERVFAGASTYLVGLNTDVGLVDAQARERLESAMAAGSWELEGFDPAEDIASLGKTGGAYGGPGAAASAYRYAWLRDTGADCEEVERAALELERALDAMHIAATIPGVEGVVARAIARNDLPGQGQTATYPLFDEEGNPLPEEKDNGTWREDNSGLYPDYIWEDSCSRDYYIGWVIGMAAAWEVIENDPRFTDEHKSDLQTDATHMVRALMRVGESGYDLEIPDADGRITYHGYMNEAAIERAYLPGIVNGFYGYMGLSIVAGLNYVAQDPEVESWLHDDLIGERALLDDANVGTTISAVNAGVRANFSGYNMITAAAWLAQRYLPEADDRVRAFELYRDRVYNVEGSPRQPIEQQQALYDWTYALGEAGVSAFDTSTGFEADAMTRTFEGLSGFGEPPFFDDVVENCDPDEVEAGVCTLLNGEEVTLLGNVGWNDDLIAQEPIPMAVRPNSNYHWRSNPYRVNSSGSGLNLHGSSDFRFVYWHARWQR